MNESGNNKNEFNLQDNPETPQEDKELEENSQEDSPADGSLEKDEVEKDPRAAESGAYITDKDVIKGRKLGAILAKRRREKDPDKRISDEEAIEQAEFEAQEAIVEIDSKKESSHTDNELEEVIENIVEASDKGELLMNDLIDTLSQLDPEIRNAIAEGIKELSSEDIEREVEKLQEKLDILDAIVRGGGKRNEKQNAEKEELEAAIAVWLVKLIIKAFVAAAKSFSKLSSDRTSA